MFKTMLSSVIIGVAALGFNAALAHDGAKPKRGGMVQTVSDLTFELVPQPDGAHLYVDDHGKPLSPAGMSGKLTVLNGSEKSEAALMVAGDKLEAKGVKLVKGVKIVAAVTTASKKTVTARFAIR
jgi:hypothetical protein